MKLRNNLIKIILITDRTVFFKSLNLYNLQEKEELFPTGEDGKIQFSDVDYVDTWKEMEQLVQKGLTKSIGLSNFNKRQIARILSVATIKYVTCSHND